jgi:D-arabinose 1-dehydrogenase-like Zn-dependent alcohol dehydrogenase
MYVNLRLIEFVHFREEVLMQPGVGGLGHVAIRVAKVLVQDIEVRVD